jgi:hypothetical protein
MADFINTADVIGDDEMCDQIIMRTVTEYKENRISKVGEYAFNKCTQLAVVDIPNVTSINMGGFSVGDHNLIRFNAPKVTRLEHNGLAGTNQNAPDFSKIAVFDFHSLEWCGGQSVFNIWFKAFIIRTPSVCTIQANTFYGTNFDSFTRGGRVYVPRNLVESYKVATNWSKYADYILPLEDYTHDGTVNGSLFWCSGITLDKTSLTIDSLHTATLTATMLAPSPHGFDDISAILWSSSDTSVATVNNGVVTPVNKGTATITASHNGHSATCKVVVNVDWNTPMYSLPSSKKFNGTSDYVDTGIKLFDTAKSFTIICKANFTALAGNICLLHCMNESGNYPGLSIDGTSGIRVCYTGSSTLTTSISDKTTVSALAIRYVDGKLNAIRYIKTSGDIIEHTISGTPTYTKVTQNLLLGAYQNTSGTKGRFYSGTISHFSVWGRALSNEQIDSLLKGV